jgi:lipopolysaccharide/colanic/teichoic acid biosynthesis glycosyltransferase
MTQNRIFNADEQTLYYSKDSFRSAEQHFSSSILYIGERSEKSHKILFPESHLAKGFNTAKQQLKDIRSAERALPALIVVNLSLNVVDLKDFVQFLQKFKWGKLIPVIYNEGALTPRQVKQLAKLRLVDDIVNIELTGLNLAHKARFLHKTKSFLKSRSARRNAKPASQKNFNEGFDFFLRRTIDILIASVLLVVFLPLMLLIMLFIKLESRGPVIYKSKRAGRGCRIFDFYKFRSMRMDADKYVGGMEALNLYHNQENNPRFFKALNDPRITGFGAFLRNTSLDELPQLINVIKGDMSLVGNRPLPLYEASTLTNDQWAERFMAPAGITGLWQVLNRGKKDMCMEDRLKLDINYARKNSLSRDFWILANTPRAVIQQVTM